MRLTDDLVLCHADVTDLRLALCQVVLAGELPPDWVQLVPAGPQVNAVDGRRFKNTAPQAVVEAFKKYGLKLPIDYEHASQLRATNGQDAPAAGWILELEVRDGSIWGKVEWTPRGVASLTSKEYRYISPAFRQDKSGNVTALVSAGLTNQPALTQLAAVASVLGAAEPKQEEKMDPKLLKLLGLDEKATPEQVVVACQGLIDAASKAAEGVKAAQVEVATARAAAATPDLTKFVPRADYEATLARAQTAEKKLADGDALAHKATVEVEIESALKAGKITPATKDFYVKTCASAEGLATFREFVKSAPVVGDASNLSGKKPDDKSTGAAPTVDEVAIATACGLTPAQFATGRV